jgi:tetratricopeptide (TPR) repeat protein
MAVQSMARPKEAVKEARHAAERALLLDPSLAEAHLSMAAIELFFGWDWAATERELKDALDLSPSLSMAHSLLACYAVARGWAERAVNSALRALDLDPISPTINTDVAWVHLLNGQYDKAKEQALSTIDMKVDYPLLHVYLGQVYLSTREYETAIQEIKKALPANGDEPAPILAMLGFAYAVAGKKEAARNVVRRMDALSKRTFISGYDWAVLHTGLGEKAAAIRCLKQALRERSPRVIWLNVEPAFDRLRGNREFKEMVRRLGVQ